MAHQLYQLYAVAFYVVGAFVLAAIPVGAVYGLDWCHRNGKFGLGCRTLARITRMASVRHYP